MFKVRDHSLNRSENVEHSTLNFELYTPICCDPIKAGRANSTDLSPDENGQRARAGSVPERWIDRGMETWNDGAVE
jgi:hypothetical protein